MSIAITIEKIIRVGLVFLKTNKRINGYKKPAIIELSETYLVAISEIVKIPNAIAVAKGWSASTTPLNVATPLPPLNCAKTGKI
jgi:hypothetical protein